MSGPKGTKRKRSISPPENTPDPDVASPTTSKIGQQPSPSKISDLVKYNRLAALLRRLRPLLIPSAYARDVLGSLGWDLNAAYDVIVLDHAQALIKQERTKSQATSSTSHTDQEKGDGGEDDEQTLSIEGGDEGLPLEINGVAIPYRRFPEQERRNAPHVLRELLNQGRDAEQQVELSRAEAVLLLERVDWDIVLAVDMFNGVEEAREHLRESFGALRGVSTLQSEQDQRLARLLSITDRPDWWSVGRHLERYQWDLVDAVDAWIRMGITPVTHPKDHGKTEGSGRRHNRVGHILPMPRRADTNVDVEHSQEEEQWASAATEWEDDAALQSRRNENIANIPKRRRAPGFLINSDIAPAKRGCPDETKMIIEWIARGRWWSNQFGNDVQFRWPGQGPYDKADTRPYFDWKNQNHVDVLNSWRRENFLRATGQTIRAASQPFVQEELDFLWQLTQEQFEAEIARNPHVEDTCSLLPLKVSTQMKEEWEECFNKRFEGEVLGKTGVPRRHRKIGALMTQRKRWPKMLEDFKVPQEAGKEKRVRGKGEKGQEKDEENGEGDGEHEGGWSGDDGEEGGGYAGDEDEDRPRGKTNKGKGNAKGDVNGESASKEMDKEKDESRDGEGKGKAQLKPEEEDESSNGSLVPEGHGSTRTGEVGESSSDDEDADAAAVMAASLLQGRYDRKPGGGSGAERGR